MTAQRTAPAGKGEGRNDRVGAGSVPSLRHEVPPRPDLWATYPDPAANYRATMFGLSPKAYCAEVARCRDAGWAAWELEARFPRVVAA